MRLTLDQWALELAAVTARRSTCLRRDVGCVLLNTKGHVIGTGYNGVAAGLPHCNEPREVIFPHACPGAYASSGQDLDGCHSLHAEQNALLQCHDVYQIHTCYVTTSPCVTCTKLLLNTSCQRVVFAETYPNQGGKALWEAAGREWLLVKN